MSSLPARIKRIRSKTTEKNWRHCFPHYKSMGAFCCHGNQSFDPICPATLCSLSSTPVMLHIKYDKDWTTGFRDIQVQKCEIFVTQGQLTRNEWSDSAQNRTRPSFYAVSKQKLLGIYTDENLILSSHIDHLYPLISSKISQHIFQLTLKDFCIRGPFFPS